MTTSDIISGSAVVVSVVALVLGNRANKKADRTTQESNEIQKRLLAVEEGRENEKALHRKKADLILSLERYLDSSGGTQWRLRLDNNGEAEARSVQVFLNQQSIGEIGFVMKNGNEAAIVLGAHNSCGWPLAVCSGFTPPWDAVVTWEDESGEPGRYQTTLMY